MDPDQAKGIPGPGAKEVRARLSAALSLRDCSKSKRDVYSSVMLCRSGAIRSGITHAGVYGRRATRNGRVMRRRTHPRARLARDIVDRQDPLRVRIVVLRQGHAPAEGAAVGAQLPQLLLDERSVGASCRDATLRESTDPTQKVALRQAEDGRAGSVGVGVVDGPAGEWRG